MLDAEIEYSRMRSVLFQFFVDVIIVGIVLLPELSWPLYTLVLIVDDVYLAEADDALDMVPPVVLFLYRLVDDRKASLGRAVNGIYLVSSDGTVKVDVIVGVVKVLRYRVGITVISVDR